MYRNPFPPSHRLMNSHSWVIPDPPIINMDDSAQLLTPPESQYNYQGDDIGSHLIPTTENTFISASFHPGARLFQSEPDLILVPRDCVYYYVHCGILLGASDNGFNSSISVAAVDDGDYVVSPVFVPVPESSSVLNVVLCAIYGISSAQYCPTLDTLSQALSSLKTYGVSLSVVIASNTPLYNVLLEMAPDHPLDIFALASQYDLYSLAASSSSYLLSLSLSTLSDEMAERIGPIYLKRLFFMHLGRAEVLRSILLPPPYPHIPTSTCDYKQQKNLTRAWTLASAHLIWDARADISTAAMENALFPLGDHLLCDLCRTALTERINILIQKWSTIKRTI